jgi:hypothetical protein
VRRWSQKSPSVEAYSLQGVDRGRFQRGERNAMRDQASRPIHESTKKGQEPKALSPLAKCSGKKVGVFRLSVCSHLVLSPVLSPTFGPCTATLLPSKRPIPLVDLEKGNAAHSPWCGPLAPHGQVCPCLNPQWVEGYDSKGSAVSFHPLFIECNFKCQSVPFAIKLRKMPRRPRTICIDL